MQKPPDRRIPPILFTRPTYEWISRVNQKHQQLAALELSDPQKEKLDRWAETEFLYSTLNLEGANVNRNDVARVVSSRSGANESDGAIALLLDSLQTVTALARAGGKTAALTPDLLLQLHKVAGSPSRFRKNAGEASRLVKPVPAENLQAVLESACHWYTAESFAELHPVEQASIVFLRLLEIQPFEQSNDQTSLLAASLFTLRSELPPVIIKPEMQSAYRNALEEGSRMNTKPMVEFVAEAVEGSIGEMIQMVGK
jgi:Fic family protein